ncbi:YraN family protein [bacterium]|nr:YraN family protein [bacterium]
MINNRQFGDMGEEIACKYLQDNGYKIIARNVHYSRFCELDIVALDRKTTVFVEVKTRKNNTFGSPMEAITKTKYENIKKGALNYLLEHPSKNYRIDVIGITLMPELKIEHLQNV